MSVFFLELTLVGLAAGAVLAVLLAVRSRIERVRQSKLVPAGEEDGELALPPPPTSWEGRTDRAFDLMVERADLGVSTAQALGWICLGGIAVGGVLGLWQDSLWAGALGFVLGAAAGLAVFAVTQRRWRARLQDQLPDIYLLMARSLRAGLSLDQAIALVGEKGSEPAAAEFRRCAQHLELGLALPAALEQMADRIQLADFNIFVSQLIVHRRVGGNLAQMLDRVAAATRDRNQFRGYYLAATALGRASGICISIAAPLFMLGYWLFHPEYVLRLTETPQGWTALGVALALEVIGVTWLLYLFRVDY